VRSRSPQRDIGNHLPGLHSSRYMAQNVGRMQSSDRVCSIGGVAGHQVVCLDLLANALKLAARLDSHRASGRPDCTSGHMAAGSLAAHPSNPNSNRPNSSFSIALPRTSRTVGVYCRLAQFQLSLDYFIMPKRKRTLKTGVAPGNPSKIDSCLVDSPATEASVQDVTSDRFAMAESAVMP
jgi:hypothetical protein